MQKAACNKHIYWPKRSFGQGNIFTPVCHSVHREGVSGPGGSPIFFSGGGVPPIFLGGGGLQFFGKSPIFFGGGAVRTRHRNTVNVRLVRILLECILVIFADSKLHNFLR